MIPHIRARTNGGNLPVAFDVPIEQKKVVVFPIYNLPD
jgi:hypothetical protein